MEMGKEVVKDGEKNIKGRGMKWERKRKKW